MSQLVLKKDPGKWAPAISCSIETYPVGDSAAWGTQLPFDHGGENDPRWSGRSLWLALPDGAPDGARSIVALLYRPVFEKLLQEFPLERKSLKRGSAEERERERDGDRAGRDNFKKSRNTAERQAEAHNKTV